MREEIECFAEGHDLGFGECCNIDCPRSRPLHLYRHVDSETTWISAHSPADAAEVYSEEVDAIGEGEKIAMAEKMEVIPDDKPVTTINENIRTTKTAAEWAAEGRGVVASTCE